MGAIFVSYRRGDSEGQARALYIQLTELIGKNSVFMDVDSIALGRDFRQILHERLESCDLMLALIGPGWMEVKDASGNRRLESPTDLVRQEIAAALKRNIPVTPVLLQGVQMPAPERLPEDIKDLAYRNGFELGHTTWESDVKELIKRLGLGEQPVAALPDTATRADVHTKLPARLGPLLRSRLVTAMTALAMAAGVAGLLLFLKDQNPKKVGKPAEIPLGAVTAPDRQSTSFAAAASSPTPRFSDITKPASSPAASSSPDGVASSGLEFNWPGDDCWEIFRGGQDVTVKCGAGKQALQAGRYTIKAKFAPVFMPFEVTIKPGSSTRIDLGGVFEFNWPGDDCWEVFRGGQDVIAKCGAGKQALQAGSYTIRAKFAPVFMPFNIKVTDGAQVRAPGIPR